MKSLNLKNLSNFLKNKLVREVIIIMALLGLGYILSQVFLTKIIGYVTM